MPVSPLAAHAWLGTCMMMDDGGARGNEASVNWAGVTGSSGRDSGANGDRSNGWAEERWPRAAWDRTRRGRNLGGGNVERHGSTGGSPQQKAEWAR